MKIDRKYRLDKFVDDSGMRPALSCILVENGKAIATNGHYLAVVPIEAEPDDEARILISPKIYKRVTQIEKGKDTLISVTKNKLSLTVPGNYIFDEKEMDVKFPDYNVVIPNGNPVFSISVNADYLREAVGALSFKNSIRLSFYGQTKQIRIEQDSKEDGEQFIILMPVRSSRDL